MPRVSCNVAKSPEKDFTCQIYQMKAAMCAGSGDVIGSINNDSEHTVAAGAAFIHLCLCHSPVAGPDLHDFKHILRA
jgi:hypothetical protein